MNMKQFQNKFMSEAGSDSGNGLVSVWYSTVQAYHYPEQKSNILVKQSKGLEILGQCIDDTSTN